MRKMVRSAYAAEGASELAEALEDWVAEADAETELDVPDAVSYTHLEHGFDVPELFQMTVIKIQIHRYHCLLYTSFYRNPADDAVLMTKEL